MTPDVRDRADRPARVESRNGVGGGGIPESAWSRALHLIGQSDEVALVCHVTPDGDALGSMLAVAYVLRSMGKRVVASFGDQPFAVPRLLRFLPGQEMLVPPAEFPAAPELVISFDSSTFERLGLLSDNTARAREVIVIDHHPSNGGFGTLGLIDAKAAATAMLAEQLIYRLGGRLDLDIATCLYAGLVTDTGSFRYSSTTPAVHQMAARLVATGLRTDEIARELWDRSPFGYLKVLAAALDRVALEGGLVWTYVTRVDRAAYGLPYAELEGIIDIVRRTDEAEVTVVLKEDDQGAWQVSTRSKGTVDVGTACAALGGGGHHNAAGYTSHATVEETMAALKRELGMA
ncbi:bifunctional oligoribonuclease/PAP phosphatase NrnA [Nonomuraea turkmeniaca]|uniref:Bifunctional oligoribonuclease/PAP phosphatase NrnA n=1 Tax=Nonomuraea turkmeniaca TaxID=103838 RepID=A0A5S4EYF6_9ACTN|nr:bifunctional oligoribonuclease/PAP phosphatase NrnA [Nonomuraea turkmeniaca]TMR08674.1 bifunctional oligoribonuclease/PAP phosphatase NrnA [Nonomuraea turkmeniaca]